MVTERNTPMVVTVDGDLRSVLGCVLLAVTVL